MNMNTTNAINLVGDFKSTIKNQFALATMCLLFFLWGFITVLNDILVPQLKANFDLNYTQAMLIQFCFFLAYFVMSYPSGMLIRKLGYKISIQIGLVTSSIGCFLFYPAATYQAYPMFLIALFVLASGIATMQVAANPYVTTLGPKENASIRLNFAAACNSLGTTIGPQFGALIILTAGLVSGAHSVQLPYVILGCLLLITAIGLQFIHLPEINHPQSNQSLTQLRTLKAPHLSMGAWAIFFYVGAEVTIGSMTINYLSQDRAIVIDEAEAAQLLSLYWGGSMIGRVLGAGAMRFIEDKKLLIFNAMAAVFLLFTTMNTDGDMAMFSVLALGLCNSIMFPTIFSLAIYNLKEMTSNGSGLLCTAIVGGAVIPLLQGIVADLTSLNDSFVIPLGCYVYILYYGLSVRGLHSSWLKQNTSFKSTA
jgi:FHS family L-fucose permease-like MFS transporter